MGFSSCFSDNCWLWEMVDVTAGQGCANRNDVMHKALAGVCKRHQLFGGLRRVVRKANKKPDAFAPGSHHDLGNAEIAVGETDSNLRHLAPKRARYQTAPPRRLLIVGVSGDQALESMRPASAAPLQRAPSARPNPGPSIQSPQNPMLLPLHHCSDAGNGWSTGCDAPQRITPRLRA